MPAKKLYLFKQILEVKAAHLFQCVGTPYGQYALQGSLLTKIKLKFLIKYDIL